MKRSSPSSSSLVLLSIIIGISTAACGDSGREEFADKTPNTTAEFPTAKGEWQQARTYMIKEIPEGSDECDQVDFRVNSEGGIYSINKCEHSQTGQLSAEEFTKVDELTTRAYKQTQSMVCPDIFKLNKFYATIDSQNDDFDRHFDPDRSCYAGSESAVRTYKTYLKELLEKYQDASEE